MGFVEVIEHVPRHYALLRQLRRRPRVGRRRGWSSLIDYPGFNMKLAAAAKAAGVPVLYYITPQVWAWGAGRLAELARIVTQGGGDSPVRGSAAPRSTASTRRSSAIRCSTARRACRSRAEAGATLGLGPDDRVLALFPGSRGAGDRSATSTHFVATGEGARSDAIRGLRVVVSAAPHVTIDRGALSIPARARPRRSPLLRAADAALCKSGTTTLEAAVAGLSAVVAYRTKPITLLDREPTGEDLHTSGW